jgi:hypothetical protein
VAIMAQGIAIVAEQARVGRKPYETLSILCDRTDPCIQGYPSRGEPREPDVSPVDYRDDMSAWLGGGQRGTAA